MNPVKVSTCVTPALHPNVIDGIEGIDDATRPYVAPVATVLDEAYQAVDAIHKARVAARKNPAWTEAQQILQVAQFAEKHQQRVLKRFDSVIQNLDRAIEAIDEMLNSPIEQKSGFGSINEEIRGHVKAMGFEERAKFLSDANAGGDSRTMTAVLGAPHYLSGISVTEQKYYLREFHRYSNPSAARRLEAMTAARDLLNERAPLIFEQVENAIGQSWKNINLIRKASSAAEQALIIKS